MADGFVFPGQGSQSIGMCNALAAAMPVIQTTFEEASDAIGKDLWKLVTEGPEGALNKTENTQPAMLAAGVATWRAWLERGGQLPLIMAGHSLGEYTALVCADALSLQDAACLVVERGQFMQNAVAEGEGAMAAILGLDDDAVRNACIEAAKGDIVEAVNFNAPGQVVIAGSADAVQRATELAKAAGAKRAVVLPVSAPSHCALMIGAAEQLAERLAETTINTPRIPVINNVDVQTETEAEAIRSALVRQLHNPVRWVETIRNMISNDVTRIVECGPGKVLSGLNKRIDRNITSVVLTDDESLTTALQDNA